MEPDPADIDRVSLGMSKEEVRELLGEPVRVFKTPESSWMYRDQRHSGGHIYFYFDADGLITRIQGSITFGGPLMGDEP